MGRGGDDVEAGEEGSCRRGGLALEEHGLAGDVYDAEPYHVGQYAESVVGRSGECLDVGFNEIHRRVAGSGRLKTGLLGYIERLLRTHSPNELRKFREIDIRIAVALLNLHGIVAIPLLLADRVAPRPIEKHLHRPRAQGEARSALIHGVAVIGSREVGVNGRDIEIDSRKVALILIG